MNEATDSPNHPDDERRSVETCPHRRVLDPVRDAAVCDLANQLIQADAHHACRVPRAACEACVHSFQPTASDPNPVVASLVFSAAEAWLAELNPTSELFRQVAEKRDLAVANLPRVLPHEDDLKVPEVASDDDLPLTLDQIHCKLPIASTRQGRCVRHWAVGVTTAPRRQPTIEYSVRGLTRCGWTTPHLFIDGDVALSDELQSFRRTVRSEPAGAWLNFFLGLSELVERDPQADAYLMVQDDARWPHAPDLKDYLTELLWPVEPGCGRGNETQPVQPCIVSLYTSVDDDSDSPGWRALPSRWKYGALAFIFPRTIARRMTGDPWLRKYAWSAGPDAREFGQSRARLAGVDTAVGSWAERRQISVWHPTPSIVQHVGNVSAIWRTSRAVGLRRASTWIGDGGSMTSNQ